MLVDDGNVNSITGFLEPGEKSPIVKSDLTTMGMIKPCMRLLLGMRFRPIAALVDILSKLPN